MKWLDEFKIALIEENDTKISSLLSSMPSFNTIEENQEAMALIDQARKTYILKKNRLAKQMQQLEKSRKFLLSSENKTKHPKLDIHS
ncbi:hypothetical protein RZR97_07320 [Hydrogenimonas thermophila]|uniref:hypothetical protein n=1 Tax=Hydrogenimonas thermophila TaxID=223786 RepID=UPI002936EA54|nr:hypothetical protein [Hydrogenimonas thermophila]WOE68925.1 hypothetical protein RZR91_07355 [Hydrogenimonas thermophila]WOE71432.1 hypothetical protein RZR97_07320 [Hydrogenimonas thermophila]